MAMRRTAIGLAVAVLSVLAPPARGAAPAPAPTLGARQYLVQGKGHEIRTSAPAVVGLPGSATLLAWAAQEGEVNNVYVASAAGAPRARVNPDGLSVDSLHQAPSLAAGPGGEVYVAWSSRKPVPAGGLFASDLRLSRSLDGGRTFEAPLRVNEDRAISHSFEGLAVTPDGTVLAAWIDTRDGDDRPRTWLARIADRGGRVERVVRLDDAETCVCCRVGVAAGPRDAVAVLWRKVFPGSVRDMVVGLSPDGGRTFATPALVHDDRWRITACPHRGGNVALDAQGRVYAAWYTEGRGGAPDMLFSVAEPGRRFGPPHHLHTAPATVPDHVRLAVDARGRAVVVWEDMTAARRRVLMRVSTDGGRTLSRVQTLSSTVKAYDPAVTVALGGGFVVVWNEEAFPDLRTVVQPLTLPLR
jgi:hypothetical protein